MHTLKRGQGDDVISQRMQIDALFCLFLVGVVLLHLEANKKRRFFNKPVEGRSEKKRNFIDPTVLKFIIRRQIGHLDVTVFERN